MLMISRVSVGLTGAKSERKETDKTREIIFWTNISKAHASVEAALTLLDDQPCNSILKCREFTRIFSSSFNAQADRAFRPIKGPQ
jgi:hypothetical protein